METLHQPKDIVQHYRIIQVLGQGGVGITYLAEDTKTGCKVALKALSLRSSNDWKQMELFEREARILKQLNHPAIPRYIDYFAVDTPEDQTLYIVQEWAVGKSLADLVKQGWRTNEAGVRKIAIQVLEILIYLHSLEPAVIHRDIKPHNLVMSEDGKISLVDFGAVQDTYYNTFMRGSTMVGTYGYMAPEQFRGQAVPATDLFALGATLLFLLTHRHPADLPHDRLRISFRSHLQVSDAFADWLEKMLEPDVDDRFSSAQTALSALKGQLAIFRGQTVKPIRALVFGAIAIAGLTVLNSYKYSLLALLPLNFDSNLQNFQYEVIRRAAVERGDVDAIKAGLRKWWHAGDNSSLLAMARTKQIIIRMIKAGINVNPEPGSSSYLAQVVRDEVGDSYWFAQSNPVTETRFRERATANSSRLSSWSPLAEAARNGDEDLVKLLIEYGATINPENNDDESPLYAALFPKDYRNNTIAKLLIEHGADVNRTAAWQEETFLHTAVMRRDMELINSLIKHGADVNADTKDKFKWTPLHYAVTDSSFDIAELLIAHGADVNARDTLGQTPIFISMASDQTAITRLLIKHGAQSNIRDKQGKTPFDYQNAEEIKIVRHLRWNCGSRMMRRAFSEMCQGI
jgi:serine/threonine protein kinase